MERLSESERNELWDLYEAGESQRSISRHLWRSPSTVSREVKINGGHLRYRANVAHRASRRRAELSKAMKLAECPRLRVGVEEKLDLWWSPSQVSRWLIRTYPDDEAVAQRVGTNRLVDPRVSGKASHHASCLMPIHAFPGVCDEDRSFGSFADHEIHRACRARRQRHNHRVADLAHDS